MSRNDQNPPKLATWLLRHACLATDSEALEGDLFETFCAGRSRRWYWKQVLVAIALGVLFGFRRHSPEACYGLVGTAIFSVWGSNRPSEFVLLSPLVALPALAIGLGVGRRLRWASLVATGVLVFPILLSSAYCLLLVLNWPFRLLGSTALFEDNRLALLVLASAALLLRFLATFLALFTSAWLGCRIDRPNPSPAAGDPRATE